MAMVGPQTDAELREWIQRRMGGGCGGPIQVELSDAQLQDCVDYAKQWWQTHVGLAKMVFLTATGVTEYAEALIGTDVDSVVEVVYPVMDEITQLFSWADVEINPYTWVYTGYGGYSTMMQIMQYRELGRSVLSADLDWDWDRARRVLVLTPTPQSGTRVGVVYLSTEFEMRKLTNPERWLFQEYALVQAQKVLGTIRSKYSDKPGAGGNFAMDGESMYANAENRESILEEKVRLLCGPTGFWAR